MLKKKYLFTLIGMIFLMAIGFGSSAIVQTTQGADTLFIEYQKISYFEINQPFQVNAHVFNQTGYPLGNDTTSCYFQAYNKNGTHAIETNMIYSAPFDFQYTIPAEAFTGGRATWLITCNTSNAGGFASGDAYITESGIEMTEGRSLLAIGMMGILVFLLFISLYALFNVEDYKGKFALYWSSHILMILICFAGWQIGVEGVLDGLALTGIFRVLFWIFTVAVLPMIILSGAWIFWIHTFNEHFENLIDKGEDTETAFRMAKKKSGGWFSGR